MAYPQNNLAYSNTNTMGLPTPSRPLSFGAGVVTPNPMNNPLLAWSQGGTMGTPMNTPMSAPLPGPYTPQAPSQNNFMPAASVGGAVNTNFNDPLSAALSPALRGTGAAGNLVDFNNTQTPGAGGTGGPEQVGLFGGLRNADGSLNFGTLQNIFQSLGSLGQLWQGFQANKLAKNMFNFQKDAYEKNFRNQTQSYNTALDDRINARYAQEGRSPDEARAFIEEHRLRT